jgi:hypothetical protein
VVSNIEVNGPSGKISVGAYDTYELLRVNGDHTISVYFIQEANSVPETIYVDNQLAGNCPSGDYDIGNSTCTGSDGIGFTSVTPAADYAGPGDIVYIRGGNYGSMQDVLWPKNSGTPSQPVTYRNYPGETPIFGPGGGAWPNDVASVMRGIITISNLDNIVIEGLTFLETGGWVFARGCENITIRNNNFSRAGYGAKGTARFTDCHHNNIVGNIFYEASTSCGNAGGDSIQLVDSNYNLVENNTFDAASHSLMAIRCGNFNVIRDNYFTNPWISCPTEVYREKLVEIYDCRLDRRGIYNPATVHPPKYDNTKYNLFEDNWFGYHPPLPNFGAVTSAMQFTGQNTIVRNNIFSNPLLSTPHPRYPQDNAGGVGIALRWGGSAWSWNANIQGVVGEAHEAGFNYGNRFYDNVFNGYDGSKITVPVDTSMGGMPSLYPPMENVQNFNNYLFDRPFKFGDNQFKNNIFYEGNFIAHVNWGQHLNAVDQPVQMMMRGSVDSNIPYMENNNFFATGTYNDQSIPNVQDRLIYNDIYAAPNAVTPAVFASSVPSKFVSNLQLDPEFDDPVNEVFTLKSTSNMIDAGAYLTTTVGSDNGQIMQVADAGYFYDGFGIVGEQGDLIQLEGQITTARVLGVNYATNTLMLDKPLTWNDGQGVSLAYFGNAPDIGKYEYVELCTVPGDCPSVTCQSASCVQGICSYTPVSDGTSCSNGLYCDGVEVCTGGGCQAQNVPQLDDGATCTADSCDEGTDTVLHVPTNSLCDDSNDCTTDTCSAISGCSYSNVAAGQPCSDGVACTISETCDGSGQCVAGSLDDALCPDKSACKSKTCTTTGCTYGSCPSEQGLVGYWEFEDNILDSSTNGLSSSLQDDATFGPGYYGQGLVLDGDLDHVYISNDPLLSFGGKHLTVAGWFKFNRASSSAGMSPFIFTPSVNGYLRTNWQTGQIGGHVWDGNVVPYVRTFLSPADYFQDGTWYHVASVYDLSVPGQTTGTFYLNGMSKGSDTQSVDGSVFNTCSLGIGKSSYGPSPTYFNGTIDDFRVYDRALNSTEIGWLAGLP